MKITVKFDKQWFLADGGVHAFAVRRLVKLCRNKFSESLTVSDDMFNTCVLELETSMTPAEVEQWLRQQIMTEIVKDASQAHVVTISVEGAAGSASGSSASPVTGWPTASGSDSPAQTAFTPAGNAPVSGGAVSGGVSALEQIDALVGLGSFKELCHEIHLRAPAMRRNHTESLFFSTSFLFSLIKGCGYDRMMELLSDLLVQEEIFAESHSLKSFELPSPVEDHLGEKLSAALERIENTLKTASSYIFSVDINEWLGYTGTADFKKILSSIYHNNKKNLIVFKADMLSREQLSLAQTDICDIISTRTIQVEPYSDPELRKLAENICAEFGYKVEEDVWPVFDRAISNERDDGFFYGVDTVRKIVGDMIQLVELSPDINGGDAIITARAVEPLAPAKEGAEPASLDELYDLVGMGKIADRVKEILRQIEYVKRNNMGTMPSMHMCFVGNPGTGKTTVARVIGRIMKDSGYLRNGKFFEHHAREFCAKYVGHTAPLTASLCRQAYGSVLFIDEAYALAYGNGSADYGQEAIDTLIAEMENHSDDLVVIFAGYPDDMQHMFDANPGMRSRVQYTVNFPNYTRDELYEIFMKMSGKVFSCTDAYRERAKEYFSTLSEETIQDKTFGNARFCRNLYEKTWGKAAVRCPDTDMSDLLLDVCDFEAAAQEFNEVKRTQYVRKIGFA